jgi:hypothetical protein
VSWVLIGWVKLALEIVLVLGLLLSACLLLDCLLDLWDRHVVAVFVVLGTFGGFAYYAKKYPRGR